MLKKAKGTSLTKSCTFTLLAKTETATGGALMAFLKTEEKKQQY